MDRTKLGKLWKKVLFANIAIVTVGFALGIYTENFYFFLWIAGIGVALEFALPSIIVMMSDEAEKEETKGE